MSEPCKITENNLNIDLDYRLALDRKNTTELIALNQCGISPSNIDTNRYLIAIGDRAYKSYNGKNWFEISIDNLTNKASANNCNAQNGTYYLMGGSANIIRYDKVNQIWENFEQTGKVFSDLAYDPDNDLFIGIRRDTATNNVYISTDNGETWTTSTSSPSLQFDSIGYSVNLGLYYATVKGAGARRVRRSTDGLTWNLSTTSTGGAETYNGSYFDSVEVGDDIWFIPGAPTAGNAWFLKTDDLVTWNQYEFIGNSNFRNASVVPDGDAVVIMGESSKESVWKSLPGIAVSNAPTTYQYTDNAYFGFGEVFVAVTRSSDFADSNKKILYSTDDGENWTKVNNTPGIFSNLLVIE